MSGKEKLTQGAKIIPHLWFVSKAVEAANFYASLFPDSRVDSVTPIPADTPSRSGGLGPGSRVHVSRVSRSWPSAPGPSTPSIMPSRSS